MNPRTTRYAFRWLSLPLLLVLLLASALPALADGIIIPGPPPGPIVDVPWLTIKYHHVTVTIDGRVATTRIDQIFLNEADHPVEGTYIFPLPEEAAIGEFAMWVDGDRLEGQILDRDEARRIYEDIVRQQKDPALLEYVGRDMFQARVFPIPAGGERRIELEYAQVLPLEDGLVEYVYPLNTEKFSARPLEEVSVSVELHSREPIKAIYSPSHNVGIDRRGDYNATIGYEEYDVLPDTDFVLYYTVSQEAVGLNLLSYMPPGGREGFFLLLAAPKVEIDPGDVVAKDVICVLDVSGSMRGEKIEQAQEALRFVLEHLNPEDRFNILAFSTGTRAYARGLVPADEAAEARAFVNRLEANGSTDIARALLEALAMVEPGREGSPSGGRPTILIFLTDGLPTTGEVDVQRIIRLVKDAAGEEVRIFSFGVGDDVNTTLLDSIAQNHRGVSAYVRPGEGIDEEVSAFYAKVSTPLLANLALDFGPVEVYDLYPYPLPDLFAGTQVVIAGRYARGGGAEVTLTGEVNERQQTFTYPDATFRREGGEEFIARLWASRKIGHLMQQIRLYGEDRELVDEIVELSVRYGIITPYTSFLVEEPGDALTEEGREARAEEIVVQATAAPEVGGEAVDRSEQEEKLAAAEQVVAPPLAPSITGTPGPGRLPGGAPSPGAAPVKFVGDKTFLWDAEQQIWLDTTFEADRMKPVTIRFGADDYFALIAAHPDWGRYFAVGDRVIVVLEGTPYRVVPEDEEASASSASEAPTETAETDSESEPARTPFWKAILDWLADLLGLGD
jgi:Ca-activated chloride channel family protein